MALDLEGCLLDGGEMMERGAAECREARVANLGGHTRCPRERRPRSLPVFERWWCAHIA